MICRAEWHTTGSFDTLWYKYMQIVLFRLLGILISMSSDNSGYTYGYDSHHSVHRDIYKI